MYNKKDSKANKNVDSNWRFPFKFMHYRCIHGGKLRENKVDGTRPKQSTIKLDCPVNWKMSKRRRKGFAEMSEEELAEHNRKKSQNKTIKHEK